MFLTRKTIQCLSANYVDESAVSVRDHGDVFVLLLSWRRWNEEDNSTTELLPSRLAFVFDDRTITIVLGILRGPTK